ncbi:unnamed protein product, partial [Porites evermanni]
VPASVPLLVPPQPGPKPIMEAARLASDQQLDGKISHYSYEEDLMINDATDVMIFNENNCNCSKSPPSCDCWVRVKGPFFPIKACIHADIDESFLGFNLSLTINDWKLFEMHITGKKEFTKCEVLNILGTDMKVCIRLTDLSLRPGHIGGCVDIIIPEMQLEERLGCFFMNRLARCTLVHVIIRVVFTSPSPCLVESDVEPHSLFSSQVLLIDSPDLAIVKRACFPQGASSWKDY